MQNNFIIGLIGGSGSGKSIVASAAADMGYTHIDTDKIGHEVILSPSHTYFKIIETFGRGIVGKDGEIDRHKLGEIVFSSKKKLELLSSLTHPAIVEKTLSIIDKKTIIDGAVLYKTPELFDICNKIIAVTNDEKRRIKFISRRDLISEDMAEIRIKSQPDNGFYESLADYVIKSDGDIDKLYNMSVETIKRCEGA